MASSVYIHVPFCMHICSYCDFCKLYYNKKDASLYLEKLEKEIKDRYANEKIKTLYIGGGTPSSLDFSLLKRLLEITKIFSLEDNYEFTFEANPENLDNAKLKLLQEYGVNRLSIGIESSNKKYLKVLNRYHSFEDAKKIVKLAKENGFSNINVDFMYGFADQTLEEVIEDLQNIISLDVSHISVYSLIIEEHTKLYIDKYQKTDEDTEYLMYNKITELMNRSNYINYEFSNYAKKGYESRHNLVYWNNYEYYGFGLGATAYLDNYRIENTHSLNKYLKEDYIKEKVYVDLEEKMENELILGLRKIKGVNMKLFEEKYHKKIEEVFDIKELLSNNMLLINEDYLLINPKYLYLSNEILVQFIK